MVNADWDDRDKELGLRDEMAKLVAQIISGVQDANAEPEDYRVADILRTHVFTEYDRPRVSV